MMGAMATWVRRAVEKGVNIVFGRRIQAHLGAPCMFSLMEGQEIILYQGTCHSCKMMYEDKVSYTYIFLLANGYFTIMLPARGAQSIESHGSNMRGEACCTCLKRS